MALLLFSIQVNTMKTYTDLETLILSVINVVAIWYILKFLRSFYGFCLTIMFLLNILLWTELGRRKMAFGIPLYTFFFFFPGDGDVSQKSELRSGSWSENTFRLIWEGSY